MLNRVISNNVTAAIQKQAMKNTTNPGSNFRRELDKETATTQLESQSFGDIKFNKDGSFLLGKEIKNITPLKIDYKPVTLESLQTDFGMTKAEAEAIFNPKPEPPSSVKSVMEMSPSEQKAFFKAQKVEAVVRDKEGNIVAKLYRNGMSMNLGYDGGTTPAEKLRKLESDPNVTVTYYSGDFSDYDLLKEDWAYCEKDWIKRPELYDPQMIAEAREFYKRILAA